MGEPSSSFRDYPRKPFTLPELHLLDVKATETGPFPDPFEFPDILQQES